MSLHVEILVRADLESLWRHTQTPDLHAEWDLRFSTIEYLPRLQPEKPQQFLYTTRIGFGLAISGRGETVGSREDTGSRTSALKFWSDDPRSLIREGSGFWQYVPTENGIRFLTRYQYRTRFGIAGLWLDRLFFRPLMGWATAWSFDRLRLWLEKGIDPAVLLERSLVFHLSRLTLGFLWVYQGLVPKLLFRDTGELALLQKTRFFTGHESVPLVFAGLGEIIFGLLLILTFRPIFLLKVNIALLLILLAGAAAVQPLLLAAPFNPITLTAAMVALSFTGLFSRHDLPDARCCRRRPEEELP